MRNRIAAAAAAGILTIGMAALPSAASASEVAPSTDGLAGSTTISGQIDQDMAVCTDKTCDAVQHVRKTNQQIKSDIDTAKQHAEQLRGVSQLFHSLPRHSVKSARATAAARSGF